MSLRLAFCWTNGIKNKDRFERWNDGLRAALRIIEEKHTVTYHEPSDDLPDVDWILFWEAPCTYQSPENGAAYRKIQQSSQKKALLFAGGPVKYDWVRGFNHVFVESKINEDEFNAIGVANSRAFGINTDIFYPIKGSRPYLTVTHGTCASWKRQWLVCKAFGKRALVFGQEQQSDPRPFEECKSCGAKVLGEQGYNTTNQLLNSAQVSVNCADYWGGGQRATLEAMACNLPVVVMQDSPKNREYVEESGAGLIASPDSDSIRNAVFTALDWTPADRERGRDYILSKWTPQHYAQSILSVIQ